MSNSGLKRAPDPEGDPRDDKHPFGKMQRHATRNEVVNAASAIGKQVYDQIAEEHEKAIVGIYQDFDAAMVAIHDEFAQFREVAARQIRALQELSISFRIRRAWRTDIRRIWLLIQVALQYAHGIAMELGIIKPAPVATSIEELAAQAAAIAGEISPELLAEAEQLAAAQTAGELVEVLGTPELVTIPDATPPES